MPKNEIKVVLYISMSLDGFIATDNDDLSWLSMVEGKGEDYGYGQMMERSGAYIVGRRTYDVVLNLTGGVFPQAEQLECYVITRKERGAENGVTFYSGDIGRLIQDLKGRLEKDIYCDGGGQIVQMLMEGNLIDEYIISVIPTVLGSGKRLFLGGIPPIGLKALPSKHYESGLVQLHYVRER